MPTAPDDEALQRICEEVEAEMGKRLLGAIFHDYAKAVARRYAATVGVGVPQSMASAPNDEFGGPDFIGLLEDNGGRWQDICRWSSKHRAFLPVCAVIDPTRWRKDCTENGTRIIGWWPLPEIPAPPSA